MPKAKRPRSASKTRTSPTKRRSSKTLSKDSSRRSASKKRVKSRASVLSGGDFLGSGGYSCVFGEGLASDALMYQERSGIATSTAPDVVGKVMLLQDAQAEINKTLNFRLADLSQEIGVYPDGTLWRVSRDAETRTKSAGGAEQVERCLRGQQRGGRKAAVGARLANPEPPFQRRELVDNVNDLFQILLPRAKLDLATYAEDNQGKHKELQQLIEKTVRLGLGLAAFHSLGLVHLDIKAENLLVFDEHFPKPLVPTTFDVKTGYFSRDHSAESKKRLRDFITSSTLRAALDLATDDAPKVRLSDFGLSQNILNLMTSTLPAAGTAMSEIYEPWPLLANIYFISPTRIRAADGGIVNFGNMAEPGTTVSKADSECFLLPQGLKNLYVFPTDVAAADKSGSATATAMTDAPVQAADGAASSSSSSSAAAAGVSKEIEEANRKRKYASHYLVKKFKNLHDDSKTMPVYDVLSRLDYDEATLLRTFGMTPEAKAHISAQVGFEVSDERFARWSVACATDLYSLGIILCSELALMGIRMVQSAASFANPRQPLELKMQFLKDFGGKQRDMLQTLKDTTSPRPRFEMDDVFSPQQVSSLEQYISNLLGFELGDTETMANVSASVLYNISPEFKARYQLRKMARATRESGGGAASAAARESGGGAASAATTARVPAPALARAPAPPAPVLSKAPTPLAPPAAVLSKAPTPPAPVLSKAPASAERSRSQSRSQSQSQSRSRSRSRSQQRLAAAAASSSSRITTSPLPRSAAAVENVAGIKRTSSAAGFASDGANVGIAESSARRQVSSTLAAASASRGVAAPSAAPLSKEELILSSKQAAALSTSQTAPTTRTSRSKETPSSLDLSSDASFISAPSPLENTAAALPQSTRHRSLLLRPLMKQEVLGGAKPK